MNNARKTFGLLGFPLGHSFSPLIHNSAFELLALDCDYKLIEIPPGKIDAFLNNPPENLHGFNITIPHKERIIDALDTADDVVGTTRCCNTVKIENGKLHGYNTDVAGIEYTLSRLTSGNKVKKAVVFGAGGAAKAAVWTLSAKFSVEHIVIICRNPNEQIKEGFAFIQPDILRFLASASLECDNFIRQADLLINCTPLGMKPEEDSSPLKDGSMLRKSQRLFDMVYNPPVTKLMQQAMDTGLTVAGGLDMLIVQAAEAFKIFTGENMPVEHVRKIVKTNISKG